ncbi:MAG: FemAB family XrtA/PEP-CTERM system-associated protein [Patescibacteria group bacterium]|nr:FemAB family XrtA/PEP-CTERM system-associated protein [Patescibacteria group bacterium]
MDHPPSIQVTTCTRLDDLQAVEHSRAVLSRACADPLRHDPRWLGVLEQGFSHRPFLLVAAQGGRPVGTLSLVLVKSLLFGRFLVSLPYVNLAGIVAESDEAAAALVDRAVELADELNVEYLELRHETLLPHPSLNYYSTTKVSMRLPLPDTTEALWGRLTAKARNQVRKGEKQGFTVHWGGMDLLPEFYNVFARNMRDLGTPVFSPRLFTAILTEFPQAAELCVVRSAGRPVAGALLVHGDGFTEVPSASSLRAFGSLNANDWMYWHLLQRAVARKQHTFDFGRTTVDSTTYVFKKKWGAKPVPFYWQYYVRRGDVTGMRIESGRYDRVIRIWQRLPVWLTRRIGPAIVRGIP